MQFCLLASNQDAGLGSGARQGSSVGGGKVEERGCNARPSRPTTAWVQIGAKASPAPDAPSAKSGLGLLLGHGGILNCPYMKLLGRNKECRKCKVPNRSRLDRF